MSCYLRVLKVPPRHPLTGPRLRPLTHYEVNPFVLPLILPDRYFYSKGYPGSFKDSNTERYTVITFN